MSRGLGSSRGRRPTGTGSVRAAVSLLETATGVTRSREVAMGGYGLAGRPGGHPVGGSDHLRARTGSCSWPTTSSAKSVRGRRRRPWPGRRVGAVRPGQRRCAGRLVPRLRDRRRRHPGHGRPPDVAQRVPVGPAGPWRCRPARAGADRPPGRLDHRRPPRPRCPSPRRRSPTPRPRTTSGSTPPSRRATRARSSRSASGRSASCAAPSAPRRSPTWPTWTAPCSSPGSRTRSSRRSCGGSRSRSPTSVTANNLEIFHVSHGKWETAAPIRAFVPYDGGREHPGQLHLHAGRAFPAG